MQYEFTLIVDRDASDEPYADTLFELGEGDYVPEGGADGNFVHVVQEASSLTAAIVTAIHLVEKADLQVMGVQSDDTVTLKDIAARTGRTHESVRLLASSQRGPGGFPPASKVGSQAFYSWVDVRQWLAASNYGIGEGGEFDREIAAADHLVRARRLLAGDAHRAEMANLVNA